MFDELPQLEEKYRPLATTHSASEFAQQALRDGIGKLYVAAMLRDLYGMNLMECKMTIETLPET